MQYSILSHFNRSCVQWWNLRLIAIQAYTWSFHCRKTQLICRLFSTWNALEASDHCVDNSYDVNLFGSWPLKLHDVIAQQQHRCLAPYSNLRIVYSRSQLFQLKSKSPISSNVFTTLKRFGILNTRRNRGGRRHKLRKNIPINTVETRYKAKQLRCHRNIIRNNLIIPLRIPALPAIKRCARICLLKVPGQYAIKQPLSMIL
jgi:hypothetical protein